MCPGPSMTCLTNIGVCCTIGQVEPAPTVPPVTTIPPVITIPPVTVVTVPVVTARTTVAATTCVDKVNAATGYSDCPSMISYCNNSAYYTLMTEQCPRTCGRCTTSSTTTITNNHGLGSLGEHAPA
ncbi:ShTK domain protein [Trichostrongylus colubriformis]|uniref:ShTK domain protein n=1 Tax=Trichostrongylus colubriformis TaxID=6319 RepID=A0AAN8F747_TRICO